MNPKLLIIDDDEDIRAQTKWGVSDEYDVIEAEDRASGVKAFRQNLPMVVLLDLGLPPNPGSPEQGEATLTELMEIDPSAKVIILSGQSDKANALNAIALGAYDFLCKPAVMDELKIILRRAFHVAQLEREYRAAQQRPAEDTFQGMLGTSPSMERVFSSIRKVAASDAPVFVLGESGTGKEMVAQAIHQLSLQKDKPFVAINCGAIPETLLESELFGHEKGAFTGAHAQRKGRIEMAAGGTLFLDEVGELPLQLQVKLLRFLQEKVIERVGGRTSIEIDTRVIAATNVDIKKVVKEGKFREDLFYRLAVVVIELPAMRERRSDIVLLAKMFLRQFSAQNQREVSEFSSKALRALENHDWPGNVRELENRVRRAVVMADGPVVSPADLELESEPEDETFVTLKEAREAVERETITRALKRHQGKIAPASVDLGISRPTLYELMEKLGIERGK